MELHIEVTKSQKQNDASHREGACFWEEQQRAPGFSGLACFRKRITVGMRESFGDKRALSQIVVIKLSNSSECSKTQVWKKENRPMETVFSI